VIAADMTGTDVAAIIAAVAAVVAVGVLIIAVVSLTRTLTAVRISVEELRRESLPVIEDAHRTVVQANSQLVRVEGLLDTANSVSATVDSTSRLLFLVFSNPLMKLLATASGFARAARTLRKNRV
jgi:uncharacterized membrane protein